MRAIAQAGWDLVGGRAGAGARLDEEDVGAGADGDEGEDGEDLKLRAAGVRGVGGWARRRSRGAGGVAVESRQSCSLDSRFGEDSGEGAGAGEQRHGGIEGDDAGEKKELRCRKRLSC